MKVKNQPLTTIVVYAENKKGILGQVLIHFNKRSFEIHNLNVARTDLHELIVITIEIDLPAAEVETSIRRLRKIIEVVDVKAFLPGVLKTYKVAHFQLLGGMFDQELFMLLQRYGAQITSCRENELIIRKIGDDNDIQSLYNLLERRNLNAFCKSLLVQDEAMGEIARVYEAV